MDLIEESPDSSESDDVGAREVASPSELERLRLQVESLSEVVPSCYDTVDRICALRRRVEEVEHRLDAAWWYTLLLMLAFGVLLGYTSGG